MISAREKQINALKTMFNFNAPYLSIKNETDWKVLIYDDMGRDIIFPHFSLKELRELGITLHLHINSLREQIPDVSAIYFAYPSLENIEIIGKDCEERQYEKFYLNFISPISRSYLDILAALCIKSSSVDLIAKVYDQYLNFIAIEDHLIVLKQNHLSDKQFNKSKPDLFAKSLSYYDLNRQNVSDADMEALLDKYVDNLFSVFTTLGQVPVIYCGKGNAAQMIGERLHKKIQENIKDARNNLFISHDNYSLSHSANNSFSSRSCLIILDRSIDLTTPLVHTWTYQALVQDIFDYELNRVTVEETANVTEHSNSKKTIKKTYDMHHNDKFWTEHKGSPFPSVAEAIQVELENYKSKEGEIRKLKQSMGVDGNESEALLDVLSGNTTALSNVVNSLPHLLERKKFLDMHTNIATSLLDQVKHRKLDLFFEMEEKIIAKSSHIDEPLLEFLGNPENGDVQDKMRLFLVAYLTNYINEADVEKYMALFKELTYDDPTHSSAYEALRLCVDYLVKLRNFLKLATSGPTINTAAFEPKKISMFSKLMTQGSQFVMEGVQNFIVKQHKLPITRIVDRLTEAASKKSAATSNSTFEEGKQFMCFDPKLLRSGPLDSSRSDIYESITFSNVYVCMIGGGNFTEYQNLLDYAKTKVNKNISYIATDLVSPKQFMEQIIALGKELHQ